MSADLEMIVSPSPAVLEEVAHAHPENVYLTPQVAAGYVALGLRPVLFRSPSGACLGFLRKGRLTSGIDVPWLPDEPADSPFWSGFVNACRKLGVWDLWCRRVSAREDTVPDLGTVLHRLNGTEFQLRLTGSDLVPTSENHRRNVAKASKAGIVFRRATDGQAIDAHLQLMLASAQRRNERGEEVPTSARAAYYQAMTQAGAGEFYQAYRDDTALSSIFVLRSAKGGYYQSAGTSPEGMSAGASQFLVVNIARHLKESGATLFDLSGVESGNDGLERFKGGFGGTACAFQEQQSVLAPAWKRKLRTLAGLVRRGPRALLSMLFDYDYSLIYRIEPLKGTTADIDVPGLRLVKLSDEDLRRLCPPGSEFARQAERMNELGYNDAFGAFIGDDLTHISWLVSAEHDRISPIRDIKLDDGQAEITHCQTGTAWRGRGIYPCVIRLLCAEAARNGVRTVFMATDPDNVSSQRGISKAGLELAGRVTRFRFPCIAGDRAIRARTFG